MSHIYYTHSLKVGTRISVYYTHTENGFAPRVLINGRAIAQQQPIIGADNQGEIRLSFEINMNYSYYRRYGATDRTTAI
jgi:hypothetical protein